MKCIDDEIPFEIPQSWCWVRMREVIQFINGRAYKKEELLSSGKYKVLRVGNFFTNNSWYYSDLELPEDKYCNKGDLLYAWSASFGPKIWDGEKTIFHYHIWNLRYSSILFRDYLYYFLLYDKTQVKKSTTGSTMIHVSMENMNPRLIPIPPINEQHRIVTQIEEVMPVVDKYEASQIALCRLNLEVFEKLKKSIIQEAIQGKLAPQDPNDEPASVLLERIREEKELLLKEAKLKRKEITDTVIFKGEDNKYYEQIGEYVVELTDLIPFEIPDNWKWVRLRDICSICTGATFKKEEATQDQGGVRVLRGGNISPLRLCLKDDDIFIPCSLVKENILLNKNDIVTPAVTSLENIGKMARVESNLQNTTVGGFVFILRPFFNDDVMSKYLLAVMSSPSTIEYMRSITNKSGQAFYNIGKERLATTLIPVPPHNEQKGITDKLNHLFSRL